MMINSSQHVWIQQTNGSRCIYDPLSYKLKMEELHKGMLLKVQICSLNYGTKCTFMPTVCIIKFSFSAYYCRMLFILSHVKWYCLNTISCLN